MNDNDGPKSAEHTATNWLELARITQDAFKSRRDLEWKLSLGLWASIAVFTSTFARTESLHGKLPPPLLAFTYLLVTLGHGYVIRLIKEKHDRDSRNFHYYVGRAGGFPGVPADNSDAWFRFHIGVTVFVTVGSWLVIYLLRQAEPAPTLQENQQMGIWTVVSSVISGVAIGVSVTIISQRVIEARERRTRRDVLRLEQYLRAIDLILDNERVLAGLAGEPTTPPEELQRRQLDISHRLRLLGSPDVQGAYDEYRRMVLRAIGEGRRSMEEQEDTARDRFVELMARDVGR